MCVLRALLLGALALGAAGTTANTLGVGFLGDDLSEANAYMRGFDFWVWYVNDNVRTPRAGFLLEGIPFRIDAVREQYNESADETWVQNFAEDWARRNIWMVVLAVPVSSAHRYSNAFTSLGINHIDVVTTNNAWFGRLANRGLFGIQPPTDDAAKEFFSMVPSSSNRGVCSLTTEKVDSLTGTSIVISSAIMQARNQGVSWVLAADFEDKGQIEETRAFMRNYSQAVVESGCDVFVAHVEGAAAAALQEALANVSAPLVAELILPKPDGSLWRPLGKRGEQVLTATPWHHSAHYDCRIFDDSSDFVTEFGQWHLDTFNIDKLPSAEEAMAVAGGVVFQTAANSRTWFSDKPYRRNPDYWQDLAAELAAERAGNDTYEDGNSGVSVTLVDTNDSVADDNLPYIFFYRMRKSLEEFDQRLFFGAVSFNSSGARSSGDFITVQYFENASERAVRPLSSTEGGAVLPVDTFQSRFGCPPGTAKRSGATDVPPEGATDVLDGETQAGAIDVPGAACVLCSGTLEYQDESDQVVCKQCPLGYVPSESRAACVPCGPGNFRGEEDDHCRPCAEGEFASTNGSSACQLCPPGEFAERGGQSACEPCPSGSISPQEGARSCFPCTPGFSTDGQLGTTGCLPCAQGFYSEGMYSSNCTACPDSFSTEVLAADSQTKCVCPPGSYWHKDGPETEPRCQSLHCADALLCEGWNNDPPLVASYYSGGSELFEGAGPAYLVRCASKEDCPGGLPLGMCPATRANVPGCSLCIDGWRKHLGECVPCSETPNYVPLVILLVGMFLAVIVIYGFHFRDYSVDSKATIKILATAGIGIPALQILVVFRFIEIDWPEPIATIHSSYAAVFEPTKLMNLKCMLPVQKAWQSYLSVVLLWPVVASLLFVVLIIPRWLPAPLSRTISNKQIFQLEGLLILTLYISISMLSLEPWQCEANPDGTSSVMAHRQVLCWDSQEHVAMLAMSTLNILIFIVGFMSLVAWATYQYPIRFQGPHGLQFLTRFGWIFNRYKAEKYYYGLAYCARNLSVTLVPVIFAGKVPLQLLLVACMLLFSFGFQCWVQPWKTGLANKLDAASCVLLILTLVAACVLLDLDPSNMKPLVSAFFSITWGVLGLGIAVMLCQNAYAWWIPHQKHTWCIPRRKYTFFLCHHKQGAAMLARWMKIQLKLRQPGQVFLDSDMLHRVDTLFEAVGHQTENLVVLLTKDTLSRIWCAGEIATAMQCKVHTILIAGNDYEDPSDEFIGKLGDLWSSGQLTEVAQQGVALEEIQEAYRMIRDMPKVHLDRTAGIQEQIEAVEHVLDHAVCGRMWEMAAGVLPSRSSAKSKGLPSVHVLATPGSVVSTRTVNSFMESSPSETTISLTSSSRMTNLVVGNLADPETVVVCRVVQHLLQPHIQAAIIVASTDLDEAIAQLGLLEQPAVIAVVLTRGVLERPAFAALLVKAVRADGLRATFAPIIADHYFTIPDAKFLGDLEEGHIISAQELEPHGIVPFEVARAYKCLFRTICKRFSTEGSERVQQAEIQEIAALFQRSEASNSDSRPSGSSAWSVGRLRSKHSLAQEDGEDFSPTATASTCTDSRPATPVTPGRWRSNSKSHERGRQLRNSSPATLEAQLRSKRDVGELVEWDGAMPEADEPSARTVP